MVWIFLLFLFQSVLLSPKLAFAAATPFGSCPQYQIDTALGCIPVQIGQFVPWLASWIFGVVGGIAFLMMVYGFFLMATSGGDPKAVQGAKETITSAISGLLLSVFGMFVLRLIALDILQIPGLK